MASLVWWDQTYGDRQMMTGTYLGTWLLPNDRTSVQTLHQWKVGISDRTSHDLKKIEQAWFETRTSLVWNCGPLVPTSCAKAWMIQTTFKFFVHFLWQDIGWSSATWFSFVPQCLGWQQYLLCTKKGPKRWRDLQATWTNTCRKCPNEQLLYQRTMVVKAWSFWIHATRPWPQSQAAAESSSMLQPIQHIMGILRAPIELASY